MKTLAYIHWHEAECQAHAKELEAAGYEVRCHWSKDSHPRIGDDTDALIVSLDRLPSHGRAIAEWFWEAKRRQTKPLIFVGGEADKVAETKKKFPGAVFCAMGKLKAALDKALPMEVASPKTGKHARQSR